MKYKVKTRLTTMVLLALMAFGTVSASEAVSEKDNFYQAVNGHTLATKKIRPTEASWSWFSERSLENKQALGKELEAVAAKEGTYAKGTPEQKIADLYACAIDNKQRNTTARAHLQELTGPIEKARTLPELTAALQAVSAKTGTDIFVGYTVDRLPTGLRYVPRILTVTPSFTRDELEKEPGQNVWRKPDVPSFTASRTTKFIPNSASSPKKSAGKSSTSPRLAPATTTRKRLKCTQTFLC